MSHTQLPHATHVRQSAHHADFTVQNHGSVAILFAHTPEAEQWVAENVEDGAQSWGRTGTVVEPRYVGAILAGIINAGLSVGD